MIRKCAATFLAALVLLMVVPASHAQQSAAEQFDQLIGDAKAAMLADPNVAIAKAKRAEHVAAGQPAGKQQTLNMATAQWLRGEASIRLGEVQTAAPLINRALRTIRQVEKGSKLEGDLLLSRGGIAVERGKVADALADYQAAHGVFREVGDTRSQTKSLIQIASLYYGANDWTNALKYFGQALEFDSIDPGLAVAIRNGRGNALKELGRNTEAEQEFSTAVAIARQVGSPLLTATVLNNAARNNLIVGKIDAAERAIGESRSLTRSDSPPGLRTQQLAIAAQAALQRRNYQRAAVLIDEAFAGVDLANTTLADREAHRTGYEANRALGRMDLALAHLSAWKRLDDDATTLARSNSAALMGAQFDFANQELRIAKLKADDLQKSVAIERARVETQQLVLAVVAITTLIIIVLLATGLIMLRRSRDRVRAANIDLEASNIALARALAARTEFLATTSHEIRTPLNGILGMTQVMLADAQIAGDTRERLGVVHGAGMTMRALVDDILDVSKMETGNLTIERAPVDIPALITEACRMWEEQAVARGLTFTLDLSDAPHIVESDAGRLRQVVFNLLSNALKFTAAGAIRVAVSGKGSGRLRLAVSDSGIGIASEKQKEIFEPFRQADAGTTRQFGGTGLGLAICWRLGEALGGEVGVESTPGAGATFFLDVPATETTLEPCEMIAEASDALLIIERNPIRRAMLKALFEPECVRVVFADGAEEASDLLSRGRIGRVLIDDATIGTDRVGALVQIVEAAHVADAEPIALWAGDPDEPLGAGITRIVAKPITGEALVVAVMGGRDASRMALLESCDA